MNEQLALIDREMQAVTIESTSEPLVKPIARSHLWHAQESIKKMKHLSDLDLRESIQQLAEESARDRRTALLNKTSKLKKVTEKKEKLLKKLLDELERRIRSIDRSTAPA